MKRARIGHLSIAAALTAMFTFTTLASPASIALAAPGTDVCAESNNSYQTSCYLGPNANVFGFLSTDGDADMYRIEPLDFGAKLRVALTQQPFPYRLAVYDWDGNVIGQTQDGQTALGVQLGPPGSYYLAVSQQFSGQFSASAPYQLTSQITHPGPVPSVAYSATFRADGHDDDGYDTSSDKHADYETGNGRMTIKMKKGGLSDEPEYAGTWLPVDELGNFTLSMDVRIANQTDGGYDIMFRSPEDAENESGYRLRVRPSRRQFQLEMENVETDVLKALSPWKTSETIKATDVNRVVIRARGNDILVNINGTEVAHLKDGTYKKGVISFEALSYAKTPAIVSFGNILVTTD